METNRTTMTDTPEPPARPGAAGAKADKTEESSPSQSTPTAVASLAAVEAPVERPSFFERLAGLFRHRNGSSLREEIADALAETATDAESFSPGERAMLHNILRLREVRVEDVMIPRADIEAVEIGTTLGALLTVFEQSGHSRMPVYAETLDDPRGMVHIRDVLAHITKLARAKKGRGTRKTAAPALDFANVDLTKTIGDLSLMRTVLFVPPSMLASDLMGRMQASRTQMALVIDEYGGTDGLISIEDLVEIVVGDIEDEHDLDEAPTIAPAGENRFTADARATLEELKEATGIDLSSAEVAEEVDTLGGLIVTLAGRVPVRGELIRGPENLEFEVLDADPRRVKRLRISTRKERPAPRTQRESRRREATPESGQPSASDTPTPPPSDGTGPQ
jgi:CBS domain containing-hemolysin-like protein